MAEIAVTVDCVLFFQKEEKLKVLLVQRKNDPFKGEWALPGGFLEEDEDLENGARRELKEETGLEVDKVWQIRAFGKPHRDPRGRTISIAFMGIIEDEKEVKGSDDASDARWFDSRNLPELAFDHREIIEEALSLL